LARDLTRKEKHMTQAGNPGDGVVVVVGLGEVGGPLLELIQASGTPVVGIDVNPGELPARGTVDVMHICIPFEIPDFVGETARYIELLDPRLTIVDSTVAVGTTRAIYERTGAPIANSPVRGKHARMVEEMRSYVKFVGGIDEDASAAAVSHFESVGLDTKVLATPETAELAKLSETTYFGLLIAWAQEMERYTDLVGVDYDEVVSFYTEIGFLPPVKFFPGVIGGHCVMPNIEILSQLGPSDILQAIRSSNEQKIAREESLVVLDAGAAGDH
jgi:UDP-N-acetyl-D-mannosaminuronate dehydrogenase